MKVDKRTSNKLSWSDFTKVEMRIGTIIEAKIFQEARNPAYKMIIDFGAIGKRKTSAQVTKLYTPDELLGKQVVAVVNFPPKQIANIMSECLVLGGVGGNGEVTLIQPESRIENGTLVG